jgi:hypothetical protein
MTRILRQFLLVLNLGSGRPGLDKGTVSRSAQRFLEAEMANFSAVSASKVRAIIKTFDATLPALHPSS